MMWRLLLGLSLGMALNDALADWPGDVYASGTALIVSVAALVAVVKEVRAGRLG